MHIAHSGRQRVHRVHSIHDITVTTCTLRQEQSSQSTFSTFKHIQAQYLLHWCSLHVHLLNHSEPYNSAVQLWVCNCSVQYSRNRLIKMSPNFDLMFCEISKTSQFKENFHFRTFAIILCLLVTSLCWCLDGSRCRMTGELTSSTTSSSILGQTAGFPF